MWGLPSRYFVGRAGDDKRQGDIFSVKDTLDWFNQGSEGQGKDG